MAETFAVEPSAELREEIAFRAARVDDLIGEAMSNLAEVQGDVSEVVRCFVENGYSKDYAEWLANEAKCRVDAAP